MAAKATNKLGQKALDKMLVRAVLKKDALSARRALSAGANPNQVVWDWDEWTPMLVYIATECPTITALLVAHGADVGAKGPFGMTALHMAGRFPERVMTLLAAGADHTVTNDDGDTALHFAMNIETAKLLIAHGADPYARNDAGLLTWEKIANLIAFSQWSAADVGAGQIAIDHIQSLIGAQKLDAGTPPPQVTTTNEERKAKAQEGRI
jgi:hypothetical protein